MKSIAGVASLVLMTGCASFAGQHTQPISVQTIHDNQEMTGVGCTLTNDAGSWFVTTPASVQVHKSTGDLAISCKKESFAGEQTLVSKSNGAVWGNVLLGGGVGYIVDRNTGAGFDYPATTTVMLRKLGDAAPAPAAAASNATASVPPQSVGATVTR